MLAQNPLSPDDLPTQPGSRILRAADADAWREGYRFLALVRETAAKTEANARRAYEAAYEKGFAEGQAAGASEANQLVQETTLAVDRYLSGLDVEISTLVLNIVRRVVGEIDVAELVVHAVTQAMTEFRHEKNIRVAVHPTAAERVKSALAVLAPDDQPTVTVEPDHALDKGACILVSDDAVVDASIEVQMRTLEAELGSGSAEKGSPP
ncbi:type III secretion system stator protein SctL [Bradyrhizobium sp.]|uniref:type III secretion system stator protein SctL n=1 Tax=Bradyrhizobium sp. TaxID=376 RepID=UPI003C393B74